jgi:uncharacterized caspase-like protein
MRNQWVWLILALALLTAGPSIPAAGEERVAFIIGNSDYLHAEQLKNPGNDASALKAAFTRLGYQVIHGKDLSQERLTSQVRSFVERLVGVEVAVFFYAGHGLQIDGKNFLVPVDFDPNRQEHLTAQLVQLDIILEGMSKRARHTLVFLDACRDNPFTADLKSKLTSRGALSLDATRGVQVVGTGLAEVKGRVGTLIAYATQPGNVASDGVGLNSPFTSGLLKNLEKPGLEVRELLTKVRVSVVEETAGAQIPWDHSSLLDNFYIKKMPRRFVPPP